MMSNNSIKVSVTKDQDLILTFDLENKTLSIFTDNWTVITKRAVQEKVIVDKPIVVQQEEQEKQPVVISDSKNNGNEHKKEKPVVPNKKVQATAEELKLKQIMEIFESMMSESFDTKVNGIKLRNRLIAKNVITAKEFNSYLNNALSKDLIEESEDRGYYKLKTPSTNEK